MSLVDDLGKLRGLQQPLIETREAASRLNTSLPNASRILRTAEGAGLARQVRHGLWALDPNTQGFTVAPYLTSPFPAYVSLWSALARYGMIEQIPGSIFVVSLDRTKTVKTNFGQFSIHHITPELFTGFDGDAKSGYLASSEKALFDVVYMRAPRGGEIRLPELSLPPGFDEAKLDEWVSLIPHRGLQPRVKGQLEGVLATAERDQE